MSEHTPGPWQQSDRALGGGPLDGGAVILRSFPGNVIPAGAELDLCIAENVKPANARRIVACINACEGIATENLEHASLDFGKELRAELVQCESERDRLREQNKELVEALEAMLSVSISTESGIMTVRFPEGSVGCETKARAVLAKVRP